MNLLQLLLIAQLSTTQIANWATTGLVGTNMIMEIKENHDQWKCLILKNSLGIGVAELTKLVIHKDRPDHSNNKSFYSEHSQLAMINSNWNPRIGISISLATGVGRVIAKKHDWIDVSVGLGVGFGLSKVCE